MIAKRWVVGNSVLVVAAAVLAAGCGDEELVELTGKEADVLALQVGAVSSMAWFEKRRERGDGPGEYEFVIPCSTSGNVTFSGTSKREWYLGNVTSLVVDGTQRYNACAEVVERGETVTLYGTVNEAFSFAEPVTFDMIHIAVEGSWRGTVVWSRSDGNSGECEVGLALDANYLWSSWSGEEVLDGGLDGRFCAIAVDAPFEEWYDRPYAAP